MPTRQEGGTRPCEFWYCAEELNQYANPVTPADPSWRPFSSVVSSAEPGSDVEFTRRIGAGNIDPVDKVKNPEDHSLTVSYELERFPVDATGKPVDPFGDVAVRTEDNELTNTHSYLEVQQQDSIIPDNSVHGQYITNGDHSHPAGTDPGAVAVASRSYLYAFGGRAEEATLASDPSDTGVCTIEMPYQFDKLRPYQIDQPPAENELALRSTAAADTDITVDIETVDGSVAESLTTDATDATTLVGTTATFPTVRCVDVRSQEHAGDIEVFVDVKADDATDTTPVAGQLLTVVHGSSAYQDLEADEGVPALNDGSFGDGSSLTGTQYSLGNDLLWTGGRAGDVVSSATFTVSNEIESTENMATLSMSKTVNGREITADSTVFGQTERYQKFSERLRGQEGELRLELVGGDVFLPRGYISDGGMAAREEEQAQMNIDTTISALQPEGGGAALEFVNAANI